MVLDPVLGKESDVTPSLLVIDGADAGEDICVERICRGKRYGSGEAGRRGTRDRLSCDAPPYVCVSAS